MSEEYDEKHPEALREVLETLVEQRLTCVLDAATHLGVHVTGTDLMQDSEWHIGEPVRGTELSSSSKTSRHTRKPNPRTQRA